MSFGRALTSFAFACACASQASAHEPPKGVGLAWASDDPDELPVIVTNRGLVFAEVEDGETRFSLRCSEAYGASTSDRPGVFVAPDGTLTLGVYSGVQQSSDRACTLQPSSGLPDESLGNMVSTPNSPNRLFVATRTVEAQAGVFVSDDFGRSWSEHFANPANEFYDGLLTAPSLPGRLYAHGFRIVRTNPVEAAFLSVVSIDGGETWQEHAHATKIIPFAVHPQNPEIVFAYEALDQVESEFRVLRSVDQGATFASVLEVVRQPATFAGSPDGSSLWIGIGVAGMGGLYQSTDGGLHFERILADSVQTVSYLAYRQGRLWLCANMAPNTNGVWSSDDQGASFQKLLSFEQVRQPLACEGDAQDVCVTPWLDFAREQLQGEPADGGIADAGIADTGTTPADPRDASDVRSWDAITPDASVSPDGQSGSPESGDGDSSGCHVRAKQSAGGAPPTLVWLVSALLMVAFGRRRV